MLDILLTILFIVLLGMLSIVAVCYFWAWFYYVPTSQDETGFLRTEDGWRIAVHRYRARGTAVRFPVLLCHGLGGNRYSFDLRGAPSLASFLSRQGWDVWVVELRGSGMSDRPGLWYSDVPYSWDFDDHLRADLPAVIEYVLKRSGASSVHWIGHSMGGMLAEAYLASQDDPRLASVIAIGSPADFSQIFRPIFNILLKFKCVLDHVSMAPLQFVAKLFIPVIHRLPYSVQSLFNAANIDPVTAKRMIAIGAPMVMSSKLWLDFARFLESREPTSETGVPYLENFWASKVPVLLISGLRRPDGPPGSGERSFATRQRCR